MHYHRSEYEACVPFEGGVLVDTDDRRHPQIHELNRSCIEE